ncbi:MAG: beta-N-acetylglucosaminidase domain-containing protein [Bacteroidales bacterium]
MNKIRLFTLIVTAFFANILVAQVNNRELHPLPQKITDHNRQISLAGPWRIDNKASVSEGALTGYEQLLSVSKSSKQIIEFRKLSKKSPLYGVDGGYALNISEKGIRVEANAENGYFYALQTLTQLIQSNDGTLKLPVCEIEDYPNINFRGTVEGFYGEPWTHTDRLEQLKFYGKLKMNTYIYGPKDDPYHSSPNWRQPYPEKEANQIKELVEAANQNYVNFVWAIHPGKDIKWNRTDSLALIDKFEKMYELGVRHFAVFFDDISGDGVNANKQADLLNYIQSDFLEKKKNVTPLIMCPTEYNKSWSNPAPGTYLDILGEKLHPNVQVMWTGNSVVADITREGLDWINNRIKRNAYIWWNFPVSDYVRDHLLMGPSYGLDKEGISRMSGFVSNPMDKAEPSKVAIFSVGEYTWNMKAYDPQQSWEDACHYIMREAPEALLCFAAHNSDPGHNWHRYRREESVKIKPVVDAFVSSLEKGQSPANPKALVSLFDSIAITPSVIRNKSNNKRLLEQIDPWLKQFELLGKAGRISLIMAEEYKKGDLNTAWDLYKDNSALLNEMEWNDLNLNQNPYQPGVKTGSLVLTPFVKRMNTWVEQGLLKAVMPSGEHVKTTLVSSAPAVYSSIQKLQNQAITERKQVLSVSPILEVMDLNPGQYIGLSWGLDRKVSEITFNLGNVGIASNCLFEVSKDGQTWTEVSVENNSNQFNVKSVPAGTCLFRIKSEADAPIQIRLNELRAKIEKSEALAPDYYAGDANLNSFVAVGKAQKIEFRNSDTTKKEGVSLFVSALPGNVIVKGTNAQGVTQTVFAGRSELIRIAHKDLVSITVFAEEGANIHEVVWK